MWHRMFFCGVTTLMSSMGKGGEPQSRGCQTLTGGKFVTGWSVWTLPLLATGDWLGSLSSCLLTITPKPEDPSCPSDHGTGDPTVAKGGMAILSLKRTVVCGNTLPAETTCIVTGGTAADGMGVTCT